ncbi:MAG: hypothetical protein IKJ30_01260 [Bacilli bacterium]|nr:hypothetical protein [Bacilli bacterium]
MYYYNGGYPGSPMGYPVYQQSNNNSSLWSIILIIFILFIIIGLGFNGNGIGNMNRCCM